MDTYSATCGDGTLDEALERLHLAGPEREGWLSNHAPMAVEALARHGHGARVHRWLDGYRAKLENMPAQGSRITAGNWAEALGDPRRIGDWTAYFTRELAERPWRQVLAQWWPRLLPGISAGATHAVIRVGHAVRTLLGGGDSVPRIAELGHGLAYWAARHAPLDGLGRVGAPRAAAEALAAVERVPDQSGGIRHRLPQIAALPGWPVAAELAPELAPDAAREQLTELVRAATHRYATHGHGEPVMLVHAATAPNAVLRTLPALPRDLWVPSVRAAWTASAAVTAAYSPARAAQPPDAGTADAGELFERAAAHGDEHVIKLTDTALDVVARDAVAAGAADADRAPAHSAVVLCCQQIHKFRAG